MIRENPQCSSISGARNTFVKKKVCQLVTLVWVVGGWDFQSTRPAEISTNPAFTLSFNSIQQWKFALSFCLRPKTQSRWCAPDIQHERLYATRSPVMFTIRRFDLDTCGVIESRGSTHHAEWTKTQTSSLKLQDPRF